MIALLDQIPALKGFSRSSLNFLARGVSQYCFKSGEQLLYKGQSVAGVYLVVQGRLNIFNVMPNGQEKILYSLEKGETCLLALNALFNDLLYPAWIKAEKDSIVAMIPDHMFDTLFEVEPAARRMLFGGLSKLVFGLMAELQQEKLNTLDQRLAQLLINRANAAGEIEMTQQQIIEHLCGVREQVVRSIKALTQSEIIVSQRGLITIIDSAKLSHVATFGTFLNESAEQALVH